MSCPTGNYIVDLVGDIASQQFYKCTGLIAVIIAETVTGIESSAFQECTGVTSVDIPGSVTFIGNSAFSSCTSLQSVVIPDSVTSIGDNAFTGCSNLENITLSTSLATLGGAAFQSCSKLAFIYVGDEVNTLPKSVTQLSGWTFNGCPMQWFVLPDSIKSVREYEFADCRELESFTFSNNMTETGESCVNGCKKLVNVTFGSSLVTLSRGVFANCVGIKEINIPNTIKTIGHRAFHTCTILNDLHLPDSVISIEGEAFVDCKAFRTVVIPDSVTSIANNAWSRCTSVVHIDFPRRANCVWGTYVFSDCTGLKEITIRGLLEVPERMVSSCYGLVKVIIEEGVEVLNNCCFAYCSSMTTLILPSSLRLLRGSPVYSCSKLTGGIEYRGLVSPNWEGDTFQGMTPGLIRVPSYYKNDTFVGRDILRMGTPQFTLYSLPERRIMSMRTGFLTVTYLLRPM